MNDTVDYLRKQILILEDRVANLEILLGEINTRYQKHWYRHDERISNLEINVLPVGPSTPTKQQTIDLLASLQEGQRDGQRGTG